MQYLQQPGRAFVLTVAIVSLLLAEGCREQSANSFGGAVVPGRHVASYFLVSLRHNDVSIMDIYVIEEPSAVDKVGCWIKQHVNSSETVQKARGLVLQWWHDELLRFDEHGQVISSDFLADDDVISRTDLVTLKKMFQDLGKRVNTVPGRKPPKQPKHRQEQALIEKDERLLHSK